MPKIYTNLQGDKIVNCPKDGETHGAIFCKLCSFYRGVGKTRVKCKFRKSILHTTSIPSTRIAVYARSKMAKTAVEHVHTLLFSMPQKKAKEGSSSGNKPRFWLFVQAYVLKVKQSMLDASFFRCFNIMKIVSCEN